MTWTGPRHLSTYEQLSRKQLPGPTWQAPVPVHRHWLSIFFVTVLAALAVLVAFVQRASAHDWERSEGRFFNSTDTRVACYGDDKNHPGLICRRYIAKGESCFGDAMGAGDGAPVFKVPNRSLFIVHGIEGLVVSPADQWSWMLLDTAKALRPGRYGWMTWSHFIEIMGDREVIPCEATAAQCLAAPQ